MGSCRPRGAPPLQPGCAQDAAVAPARKVAVVAGGASDEGGRTEDVHQACDHAHAHARVTMYASCVYVPCVCPWRCDRRRRARGPDYEDVGARPWYKQLQPLHLGLQRYPYTGLHAYNYTGLHAYYSYCTGLHPRLRGVPTRCPPMNSYAP